jgi:hypothetical protein
VARIQEATDWNPVVNVSAIGDYQLFTGSDAGVCYVELSE